MESEIGRNSTLGWQWLWAIDDWRTAVSHTHIENKIHGFSYHKSEIYISFHTAVANLFEAMRQLTINYKQGWGRLLSKVIDQITITLNFWDFLQKCLRWHGCNFTKHPCHLNFFRRLIFESERPSSSSNYLCVKWFIKDTQSRYTAYSNREYTHIYHVYHNIL